MELGRRRKGGRNSRELMDPPLPISAALPSLGASSPLLPQISRGDGGCLSVFVFYEAISGFCRSPKLMCKCPSGDTEGIPEMFFVWELLVTAASRAMVVGRGCGIPGAAW